MCCSEAKATNVVVLISKATPSYVVFCATTDCRNQELLACGDIGEKTIAELSERGLVVV